MQPAEIPSVVDVAVLGATVAGMTAARELAAAGRSVLVIDVPGTDAWQEKIPPVATDVLGPTAHEIAVRHGEAAATTYFSGLADAVRDVADDADRWRVPCHEIPGWSVAVDGHLAFELRHEARLMRLAGLKVDFHDDQPFAHAIRPFMVRERECVVDLPAYLASLATSAADAGVAYVQTSVRRLGSSIVTDAGTVRAADVIDVVGLTPTLRLGALGRLRTAVRPTVETAPLRWPTGEPLGSPADGPVETVATFIDTPVEFLLAGADGCRLIGRDGAPADALAAWARTYLDATVRGTGTLITEAATDHLPVVGRVPGIPHLWIARGFATASLAPEVWAGRQVAAAVVGAGASPATPLRTSGRVGDWVRSRFGVLADPKQRVEQVLAARGLARAVSHRP